MDRILLVAIAVSALMHVAALFGTPRFDIAWMYEEVRPAPIEARIIVREPPPPKMAEAKPKPKPARPAVRKKPAPHPKPAPVVQPEHPRSEAVAVPEAPSPDGEPSPSIAQAPSESTALPPEANAAQDASGHDAVATPPAPAIAEESATVEYPLKEARLVFDLYYGRSASKVGQVTHTWMQDGDQYIAESVAEAVGFISFFFGGRFVQRSVGHFGKTGLLPDEYTLQRGRGDKPELARFDREEGKLELAWKNESRVLNLPPNAQDPVSMLHQLYFIKPVPASARLDIATSRKINEYVYELVGEEILHTPLGALTTLHFRRREADGTLMEVWLDLHRNLLPARIYLKDRKGAVLDQVIREARIEPVAQSRTE
jgi:hypothetical protein